MAVKDKTDLQIRKLYYQKVTVNLDAKSTLSPEDFWSSMHIIAMNNKAVINFRKEV